MLSPLRLDIDALTLGSPWLIDEGIVKAHARIDAADDDDLLAIYLRAAIGWAESATNRVIFRRQCRWVLRDFPWEREIRLPCGLARSVASIAYVTGGQTITLTGPSSGSPGGTDYQEDLNADSGGVLMPPQGGSWPNADCDAVAPVTITFTVGWDAANVPAELQHAILFAVDDMYDGRGTASADPAMLAAAGSTLAVREALISPWRLTRVY
jgi:uncharacterized phiE125 gp8 family phage protein